MTAILNRSSSATSVVKDSHTKAYTRVIPGVSKRNSVEGAESTKSDDSGSSLNLSVSGTSRSESTSPVKGDRDSQIIELNQSVSTPSLLNQSVNTPSLLNQSVSIPSLLNQYVNTPSLLNQYVSTPSLTVQL
jgi:hypothetical protein